MRSIRHFVILLGTAIILLLACSALAHILKLAQTVVANSPAIPGKSSPQILAGLIGHIEAPTAAGPSAP